MAAKWVLAVALALCIAQEVIGIASGHMKILSTFQGHIENIRQRTKGMISDAGKVMGKLLATFPAMGTQAIEAADAQGIRGEVIRVERLLQAAQAAGKHVDLCIKDEPQMADHIQEIALRGLKKCYLQVQQVELNVRKALLHLFKEVQAQLDIAEKEFLSCFALSNYKVDNAWDLPINNCSETDIVHILRKEQELLYKISAEVLSIQHKVVEDLRQATICLSNEELKALTMEKPVVKAIEQCIKDLP